jgi:SpoVK/Ycf46/Vps4 family AAA+-type ATPase
MTISTNEHLLAEIDVRRVQTDTDPEELVVPPETERRLGWVADWLTMDKPVFKEWGLQRYIDSGLRVLFRGLPGTGKTMAATALGRSTERTVLAVDLGTIVSTNVAETEEHLQRLFQVAREENAILLFDEADALFGERSEAADVQHRFVNSDIAYLLRQIEMFEGLAIIMTNVSGELDAHALSRIDLVIEFTMPDAERREQLWKNVLDPVKLEKAADIDLAKLAQSNELSGSDILRCVRLAAMLAANESRPLNMELLQFTATERVEMRKLPKI